MILNFPLLIHDSTICKQLFWSFYKKITNLFKFYKFQKYRSNCVKPISNVESHKNDMICVTCETLLAPSETLTIP